MSQREAEVLEMLGAHLSNAQIAGRLHISVRTVESHVRSLLRKFGAADRRELAALAPAATSHIAAVASVLGVSEWPQQPLLEAVLEHLAARRALLVLDNCEHLFGEDAAFTERVLAACPGVRVLATSRERLAVTGEQLVTVPPLSLVA